MPHRVIQWATGNVGKQAIRGVLAHPDLELVGCWVHGEPKDGLDVGEICGLGPVGVAATRDVEALLASDADCVIYTPLLADTCLLYTSPSPRDRQKSRMPSSA